jgi:hypothetical protein
MYSESWDLSHRSDHSFVFSDAGHRAVSGSVICSRICRFFPLHSYQQHQPSITKKEESLDVLSSCLMGVLSSCLIVTAPGYCDINVPGEIVVTRTCSIIAYRIFRIDVPPLRHTYY